MDRKLFSFAIVLVSAAFAQSSGCSAAGTNRFGGTTSGSGAGTTGTGGAGGGTGLGGFDPGTGGSCSGPHCSSDLHSLVDCNGNVLMTCPADQGCTSQGCVPACDSAVANKSNIGCEYYVPTPETSLGINGACFAAYVANTWTTPVTLTMDYGGMALDPSTFGFIPSGTGQNIQYTPLTGGQIPPGSVAILFLNRIPGLPMPGLNLDCPKGIVPAITSFDSATHGTSLGKTFHLTASAPVVAYDIYPYGGGQSALTGGTLLLPSSAWDTNYVAVDAPGGFSWVQVVASADNTNVTINPTADVAAGAGVAAATHGMPTTYTLAKGQVLQLTELITSLSGSVIQSDQPVGTWGGSGAFSVEACCDDTAHQQIPPVKALGSEYTLVKYRDRYDTHPESPPWRLVGAVDGTLLTWEPSPPAGAPTTLALGQVVQFDGPGPYVVRSQDAQHPFYVGALMTGGGLYDPDPQGSGGDGRGDAEFVNVIPAGEFLSKYVFFADPTYPETDLVIVRAKGPKGFTDVKLDCAGNLTGWQPVGTSGAYEYTRVDLVRHNFAPQGGCDNGRHEIESTSPFGVTIWGWGSAETGQYLSATYSQYVSYAYPAGAGVQPINTVVVPPTTK